MQVRVEGCLKNLIETNNSSEMYPAQFPELMQNFPYPGQLALPPMFSEQVITGPQGQPINVIIDAAGQIVPPEIVHQIMMSQAQRMNHMMGSECNSVITDCTYRSGAPLMQNELGGYRIERQRSVRFEEHPQTRYINEQNPIPDMNDFAAEESIISSCEEMSSTSPCVLQKNCPVGNSISIL